MRPASAIVLFFIGGSLAAALAGFSLAGRSETAPREPGGDDAALARAIRSPDDYAWELFRHLNRQAAPKGTGVPDPRFSSCAQYEPDRAVVWETWEALDSPESQAGVARLYASALQCAADAWPARPVEASAATEFEVRFNAVARAHARRLTREELTRLFAQAQTDQNASLIQFPPEAKVVKARWAPAEQAASPDRSRYHWRTIGGRTYVLVAIHIVSKDMPTWFWASFVQDDEAARYDPSRTRIPAGRPDPLTAGSKWANYRLLGTQQAFVDACGCPTQLGNLVLGEPPLSSCITCHAAAGVRADLRENDVLHVPGAPLPEVFWEGCRPNSTCDRSRLRVLQTDFVWFVARRALAQGRDDGD